MSNISNVNLKTFSEQYAAPVNMQTRAVSDQAIGNKVDNKGLEKGDKVTIFGKEINKKSNNRWTCNINRNSSSSHINNKR